MSPRPVPSTPPFHFGGPNRSRPDGADREKPVAVRGGSRFQVRRWPLNCPALIGELAVVDTKYGDRIVRTYRDGDAFGRAKTDAAQWNKTPPEMRPRFVPLRLLKERMADGSIQCSVERVSPKAIERSDPEHWEYSFTAAALPTHVSLLPRPSSTGRGA